MYLEYIHSRFNYFLNAQHVLLIGVIGVGWSMEKIDAVSLHLISYDASHHYRLSNIYVNAKRDTHKPSSSFMWCIFIIHTVLIIHGTTKSLYVGCIHLTSPSCRSIMISQIAQFSFLFENEGVIILWEFHGVHKKKKMRIYSVLGSTQFWIW